MLIPLGLLWQKYSNSIQACHSRLFEMLPADRAAVPEQKEHHKPPAEKILLYQGALKRRTGVGSCDSAMQHIENVRFVLAGEGDLSEQLRALTKELHLEHKVHFEGFVEPGQLKELTATAWVMLNLLENRGLSYYYSLANKFFDGVQAAVPIITMDFPEYHALNEEHEVAYLLSELHPGSVAGSNTKAVDRYCLVQPPCNKIAVPQETYGTGNQKRNGCCIFGILSTSVNTWHRHYNIRSSQSFSATKAVS